MQSMYLNSTVNRFPCTQIQEVSGVFALFCQVFENASLFKYFHLS